MKKMDKPKKLCFITALLLTGGSDTLLLSQCSKLVQKGYSLVLYSLYPIDKKRSMYNKFIERGVVVRSPANTVKIVVGSIDRLIVAPIHLMKRLCHRIVNYTESSGKTRFSGEDGFGDGKVITLLKRLRGTFSAASLYKVILYLSICHNNVQDNYSLISVFHYTNYDLSYYLKKRLKIPVFYTEISSPKWRKGWMDNRKLRKYINTFDKILVPSELIANELKEFEGLERDFITLPFCIDLPSREYKEIHKIAKTFGNIGRMSDEKNQDILIRVLQLVMESEPEAKLILVGEGPRKVKYETLASNLKIEDNVMFIPHFENMDCVMEKIDIFVMVSDVEGMPLTLIEALYYGKPILATNVGAISEMVINGSNGYLIDKNNIEDIKNKILLLWNNENLYQIFSKNSRKLYEEKYSYEKGIERLLNLYSNEINM
jgi:glycosyltransferase involved in cell wall biosynthesis